MTHEQGKIRKKYKMEDTTCPECRGYGIIPDYGPFADDFYGEKECYVCHGRTTIKQRKYLEESVR